MVFSYQFSVGSNAMERIALDAATDGGRILLGRRGSWGLGSGNVDRQLLHSGLRGALGLRQLLHSGCAEHLGFVIGFTPGCAGHEGSVIGFTPAAPGT